MNRLLLMVYFLILLSIIIPLQGAVRLEAARPDTAQPDAAQPEGFLYAEITTIDGKQYVGPIRWGKEEVFWADMFNAAKLGNKYLDYLSGDHKEKLRGRKSRDHSGYRSGHRINWSAHRGYNSQVHQFSCPFGVISEIRATGKKEAEITFVDGSRISVEGEGYNDLGTSVKILDEEIGETEILWNRIQKINFSQSPDNIEHSFGKPLCGTVQSDEGVFTGFIQWDHDERLTSDEIDASTENGQVSIPFDKIVSIEKDGNRSKVVLRSGRKLNLKGSNDVNSKNRGIVVTMKGIGRVDVPWTTFKKLDLLQTREKLMSYESFNNKRDLKGEVITVDGEFSGTLVYDLDEAWNFEVLQGRNNEVEYIIPMENIKKITPRNDEFSEIELIEGEKILLGELRDVNEKNSGLLVFENKEDPVYLPWKQIKEIRLNSE